MTTSNLTPAIHEGYSTPAIAKRLPVESPTLEAQLLLAHTIGKSRSWVMAHPEATLTPQQEAAIETAIQQRQEGFPLPYLLGRWEFFGLDFDVTPAVLIPRPETELLLETALQWLRYHPDHAYRFLDVGTGSGCIPIALAVHVPRAHIIATDISPAALAVAMGNAVQHGVEDRIDFVQADLLPQEFNVRHSSLDIVTANLPYIPTETLHELPIYGHEPSLALDGGADGLALIRQLLARLAGQMDEGSLILLEIETRQGDDVYRLAQASFPTAHIYIKKDLAGHDRLVVIEL